MIAFLIAALGLFFIALAILFLVSACVPRFGGGSEPHALPIAIGLLTLGLWLIFKAGGFA